MAHEFGGEFYNPEKLPDLHGMNGFKDVSREIPTEDDTFDSPTVIPSGSVGAGEPSFPEAGLSEPSVGPTKSVPVSM